MKLVGKSKTSFEPVVIGASTTTGAGLIVPKSAMAPVLIVPDHIAEERAEEDARPWMTIEALYQEIHEHNPVLSRGKFKAQLRKMINRGLVEIRYPSKREHEYGAQKMVRPTKVGRKEATDAVS
jgi:hypothetical protein